MIALAAEASHKMQKYLKLHRLLSVPRCKYTKFVETVKPRSVVRYVCRKTAVGVVCCAENLQVPTSAAVD
jgi:hypothetical protein